MYESVLAHINSATLILTPNKRLSRELHSAYDAEQQKQGKQVWPSANILPLQTWLKNCWLILDLPQLLLNDFQERQIWQEIISQSSISSSLADISATAKLVQQAWQTYYEWELPALIKSGHFNLEIEYFIEWQKHFANYCHDKNFVSNAEVVPLLIKYIKQLTFPQKIVLVNFDILTKQQEKFLALISAEKLYLNTDSVAEIQCHAFPNTEAELTAMAQWAFKQHQSHSDLKIHCVIPQLDQIRPQVLRLFQSIFSASSYGALFKYINVSGGYALNTAPLIHTALLLLSLNPHEVSIHTVSYLLMNPFLSGAETETETRCLLDVALRQENLPVMSWKMVLSLAKRSPCILWINALENSLPIRESWSQANLSLRDWSENFSALLAAFGWPGERALNSEEYQQYQRWQALLQEFIAFEALHSELNYAAALQLLQQLSHHTLFQIETENTPIQILSTLEAAPLQCDKRWVMGLHADAWPAPALPNPFLPYNLQQKYNVPHSTAQNELLFAQSLTHRFSHSAQEVIFSYPSQENDRELLISPLLKNYLLFNVGAAREQPGTLASVACNTTQAKKLFAERKINYILDQQGPPLTELEKQYTHGGSSLFKDQSACGFQAFTRQRLHAKPLPMPEFGLNLADRGTLIHYALENIWTLIKSRQNLLNYNAEDLAALVSDQVQHAINMKVGTVWQKLPADWRELEVHCLSQLLTLWLEHEKQRPDFTVIGQEVKQTYQIADLRITLKIDRIDELANGDKVIIDYKTSITNLSTNLWENERPEEPQLPLYCITNADIRGALIAQVRKRDPRFIGITAEYSQIDKVEARDWQTLIEQWSQVLMQLAQQFAAGIAHVDPRDVTVCHYCKLTSLCRINELDANLPI